jgi:hypothetical protein
MTPEKAGHGPDEMPAEGQVCIPNIGPKERAMRVRVGSAIVAVGLGVAAALVFSGVSPLWRLAVFVPFWAGATSLWQVREKTCIALAARNVKNLDDGEAAITDQAELAQIARQARKVKLKGLATAAALTALLFAVP